jgi:hypothetical protein
MQGWKNIFQEIDAGPQRRRTVRKLQASNNQPHPFNDKSLFDSSMNRVCVRIDMIDEEEYCKEELPSTFYRILCLMWFILLSSNFDSPFSLSKWQSVRPLRGYRYQKFIFLK